MKRTAVLAMLLSACAAPAPTAAPALSIGAAFGGLPPWCPNGTLSIEPDGRASFRKYRTDSGQTLHEQSFTLTAEQMRSIADAVRASGFFDLAPLHDSGAADGTYCHLEITLDGRTHAVTTRNKPVAGFDALCGAINRAVPDPCRIFYNDVPR